MKIYALSENMDTLLGLRLSGIRGTQVFELPEGEKLLDKLTKDKEIGIILITEKLAEGMRLKVNAIKQKMTFPLIVEIPDRHGSIRGEDYITGYVRDSIGIKI